MDYNQAKAILETGVKDFNCLYEAAKIIVDKVVDGSDAISITSSDIAVNTAISHFKEKNTPEPGQNFLIIYANNQNISQKIDVCNRDLNPKEVFKQALLVNASSIFVFCIDTERSLHPKDEEIKMISRLQEIGSSLEVTLIDYIVINTLIKGEDYASFKSRGLRII